MINPITPKHQLAYSPYCSLYISWAVDMENLFNNQEFYTLLVISLILVTLMFDSGVILKGEIWSWSLLGVKGLRFFLSLMYCKLYITCKTLILFNGSEMTFLQVTGVEAVEDVIACSVYCSMIVFKSFLFLNSSSG